MTWAEINSLALNPLSHPALSHFSNYTFFVVVVLDMTELFNLKVFQSGYKLFTSNYFIWLDFCGSLLGNIFYFISLCVFSLSFLCIGQLSPILFIYSSLSRDRCHNPDLISHLVRFLINDSKVFMTIQILIIHYYCIHFCFSFYSVAFTLAFITFYCFIEASRTIIHAWRKLI